MFFEKIMKKFRKICKKLFIYKEIYCIIYITHNYGWGNSFWINF